MASPLAMDMDVRRDSSPSDDTPYYARIPLTKADTKRPPQDNRKESECPLDARDFVRGAWARDLNDWRTPCVPNGCMVCCCPCVSIAQISVRIGADSFCGALLKQVAFNFVVWALVLLELVYCYRYASSVFGDGQERTTTPPLVIFSACFVVTVVSIVWIRSLATLRRTVRRRFHIRGSLSDDSWAMAWSTPCAIAQMATQVKSYTPGSCDFRAPETLPAYIP